jgi:hypothetical protein
MANPNSAVDRSSRPDAAPYASSKGPVQLTERTSAVDERRLMRIGGLLYLIIIVLGIFSEVVVRGTLIEDDIEVTAANILDSEWLFRVGFAADLVVFLSDAALAVVLFLLFRSVHAGLSLAASAFRIVQTAVLGLNLLHMFAAVLILRGDDYAANLSAGEIDSLAYFMLELHRYGYVLGLMFFAVSVAILGSLMVKSRRFPSLLGLLLVLAALGYLVDGSLFFCLPDYDGAISPLILAPAFVGEVTFCGWLLFNRLHREARVT